MNEIETDRLQNDHLQLNENGQPLLEFIEFVSRYPEIIQYIEESLKPKRARRAIKEILVPDTVPVIQIDPSLDLSYSFISDYPELQTEIDHLYTRQFGTLASSFSHSEKYFFDLLHKEKFKREQIISLEELRKGQQFTFIPCSPRAENAQVYTRGFKVKKHIRGKNMEMISTNDPTRFFLASQLVLVKRS